MEGHHLILGELKDILTGETLDDTHDERYRQKIARLLLEKKGYLREEITPRNPLRVQSDKRGGIISVDFIVTVGGRVGMIIKYAPGSLVTRHRPVLAMSRLMTPVQIPVAVVTNGENADILDGASGRKIGEGLASIPDRSSLMEIMENADFTRISKKRVQLESRIVYCYEIDGSCPCDTGVCRF